MRLCLLFVPWDTGQQREIFGPFVNNAIFLTYVHGKLYSQEKKRLLYTFSKSMRLKYPIGLIYLNLEIYPAVCMAVSTCQIKLMLSSIDR